MTLLAWVIAGIGVGLVVGGFAWAYPPLGAIVLGVVVLGVGGWLIDIGE